MHNSNCSLGKSYQYIDALEKIQNPNSSKRLSANASYNYYRSCLCELARHRYATHMETVAGNLAETVKVSDRKAVLAPKSETVLCTQGEAA